MKILVFGDRLEVGGSQVNAIELTAALRDLHGHDVVYFATPGPMAKLIAQKHIRFVPAPDASRHPSMARMRALRDVVRRERPDIVHAWDWWQCLDAYWSVHLAMRVPLLVSDMNMSIGRVLPKTVPTTFGTPELVEQAKALGRRHVNLLVPPVDVRHNAPGTVSGPEFRKAHNIGADEVLLVTVSRFAANLKAESLRRSIEAVRSLGREMPLRLVLVGDGILRGELQHLADRANAELNRPAVLLTGALIDPRQAYAAADVVIGMGGSALRAMAFAKPVLIVGEQNFSGAFTQESAQSFFYKGIFGVGDGKADNARLVSQIRELLRHPGRLPAIGEFSREFVVTHYSLEAGSDRLAVLCQAAVSARRRAHVSAADGIRTAAVLIAGTVRPALRWPPRLPARRTAQV